MKKILIITAHPVDELLGVVLVYFIIKLGYKIKWFSK